MCDCVCGSHAGENNYLMRGRHFDVLRNVEGGVADKGVSFCLTPAKTPLASKGTPRQQSLLVGARVLIVFLYPTLV